MKETLLIRSTTLLLLTAASFYIIALKFAQISRISMYFLIAYFPVLSLLAGGINIRKNRNIAFVLILIYLIISFFIIQLIRPEWSGITPYVFLGD